MAIAFYPLALWRWGDLEVGVSAALALLAACSTATVLAMALPYLLNRLGKDPAYGSGPLATVIQIGYGEVDDDRRQIRDRWVTACASSDVAQARARIFRRNAHEEAPRRKCPPGGLSHSAV